MFSSCTRVALGSSCGIRKIFCLKGMLAYLELPSFFCSLVEMFLTSSLLLWRTTTKASPAIVSCDIWMWFWLFVFDCGPSHCYEVLGSSVVCEAHSICIVCPDVSISSIIGSRPRIWSLLNSIGSFSFILIVSNQLGLIYPLYKYIPVPCSLTWNGKLWWPWSYSQALMAVTLHIL